jgi:hypothetical protein
MKSLVYGSKRADDMVIEMLSADANNELILFLSKVHNIFDDTSWHAVGITVIDNPLTDNRNYHYVMFTVLNNSHCSPAPYGHVRSPYVRSVFVQRRLIHSYRLATLFV